MPCHADSLTPSEGSGVVAIDARTRTVADWGEGAETLFDYPASEAVGMPIDTLVEGGLPAALSPTHPTPLIGRAKSGRRLALEATASRFTLPERPAGIVVLALSAAGQARDVASRLRDSEERYRALYDDNPTIYLTVGQDSVICSVNRFGAEFLGYTREELEGQPVALLFPEPDNTHVERQIAEAIGHFGQTLRWELRKQKKNGEIIWVRDVARAIHDPTGEIVVLVVCEEITALKTLEATLVAQNKRLEHLDVLKNQFVGAVSHELRTPLTTIRGFTEFLEDEVAGPLTAPQRDYVAQIEASTQRLQRLVDDLLDFSRLEVGEFKLKFERADLASRASKVVEGLRPRLAGAGLTLTLEAPPEPVWLQMDPVRIAQVLTNLIDNAAKFTAAGGAIRVTLRPEPTQARVEVIDEGIGIALADQARIFERFVQLDGGDTRQQGGAGLGLSIARGIVEAHGGRIGVESLPGHGSTFFFVLPYEGRAPTSP